jgi:hypothetical protein
MSTQKKKKKKRESNWLTLMLIWPTVQISTQVTELQKFLFFIRLTFYFFFLMGAQFLRDVQNSKKDK